MLSAGSQALNKSKVFANGVAWCTVQLSTCRTRHSTCSTQHLRPERASLPLASLQLSTHFAGSVSGGASHQTPELSRAETTY